MKSYNKWFKTFKPNPKARIRLFCFHHSGGSASFFFRWVEHLSPSIELTAIQFPGREDRFSEPFINSLEDIVFQLSEGFNAHKDKPFFVFGHSLGALVGFEFINAIRNHYSILPSYLVVSAARAPHLNYKRLPLSQLEDESLIEKLKIYNGIDKHILNAYDLLNLFLPIIKSDFRLLDNYQYKVVEPLLCNILALGGENDQTVNCEDIHAWSSYTMSKFHYLPFAGEHFFLKNHQPAILKIINKIGESYS